MPSPQPNTLYRIQSVDFDTCLELWTAKKDYVVLRQPKETDLQQWLFIKEGTGSEETYKIMAASTKTSRRPRYLAITVPGSDTYPRSPAPPTAIVTQSSTNIWRLYEESDGSYELTTTGKKADSEVFLRTSEDGKASTSPDSVEKTISDDSMERDMRWKIVEYWPAVPKGTYRIRTLNGAALDINQNLNQLSVAAVRKDYRQEWNVEPKGNGKCVISLNVKDTIFLGWEKGKDGIAKISPTKEPVEWFVKSLGEYTYSITIDYAANVQSTLSLALSITDGEVILKPRKTAHNQIWFFENVDATSSTTESVGPPSYSDSQRYPEIIERTYKVRNIGNGKWFVIAADGSRQTFWAAPWDTEVESIYFKVEYIGSGSTFRITRDVAGDNPKRYVRVAGNTLEAVGGISNATAFVLERADDPNGGYLYYLCSAADRSQVVSGAGATGTGGRQALTITGKKFGTAIQQWKFTT